MTVTTRNPAERQAAEPATAVRAPVPWIERALEGCWLVAAAFLPLFIMPEALMAGFVQVPKVTLLRSLAMVAGVLVVVGWALSHRHGQPLADDVAGWRTLLKGLGGQVKANPIVASAIAVLLVTILGVVLSPMLIVSIEGPRPGWDSYGLYNVASYVVLFGVVASSMRSRVQVGRLMWALTAASVLLGFYGIGQHFGIDPFRLDSSPKPRVPLTAGNPIFGASLLLRRCRCRLPSGRPSVTRWGWPSTSSSARASWSCR